MFREMVDTFAQETATGGEDAFDGTERAVVTGDRIGFVAGYGATVDVCTEIDGVTVRCEDPGDSLWFVDPVADRVREMLDSLPIRDSGVDGPTP
jgi:hypothetical protein